jgi:hypothetical protein
VGNLDHLRKLLNPKIALSTVGNIILILVILGVLRENDTDTATKIAELVCNILIQIGIMTTKDVV